MNPLISVIIPVYNVENYLKKCLESVINQTYKNLEIILINDGSNDNSKDICDEYSQKDSRIIVVHKHNEGVSVARNTGLDIAKGEYIGFLDADDYIEEDMYEFLLDNAIKDNADISSCSYNKVFSDRIEEGIGFNKYLILDSSEAIEKTINKDILFPSVWLKLFKKECIKNVRFDPTIKISEDYLFCFNAACNCKKYVHSGKGKYNYIMREGSALHSITSINYDSFKVSQIILEEVKKSYSELLYCAEIKCIEESINLLYAIQKSKDDKYNCMERQCFDFLDSVKIKKGIPNKYRAMLIINKINKNLLKKAIDMRFEAKK